jgi:spore coat protein U-like protein
MWRASLLLALFCVATPAMAQQTTCAGANAAMSLGTYDAYQSTPADSSANFVVTCTRQGGPPTTLITVGIGPSANTGTIASRSLKHASASDLLAYNIYRDAGRLQVWGNTAGIDAVAQTIDLSNRTTGSITFTLFGRINALQDVRPGFYDDTLTITVAF